MKNLFALFVLLISFTGCLRDNKPADFDYGHVENGKYLNSYFKFKIDIPKGWYVQSKEEIEEMQDKGKSEIVADNDKLKAAINASEINTANLFSVFQFEKGSPVDFNPSLIILVENTKNAPGIKTGADYLFHSRKLLEQTKKYDNIDKEFSKETYSGVDFYKMNANINYAEMNIHQVFYSAILKNFSFDIIISYTNDEQKDSLLQTLGTMNFDK